MRLVSILQDLSLALLVGGIAAVSVAAFVLFDTAPTHEIAGQIGNELFAALGPVLLGVALVNLAARLGLMSREPASFLRTVSLVLATSGVLVAGAIALWLTPRLGVIWTAGAHAPDGSGLAGDASIRFARLHGLAGLSYMTLLLIGIASIFLRNLGPAAGRR